MSINESRQIETTQKENAEIRKSKDKKKLSSSNIKRLILVPKDDELNPNEPLYKYVEKVIVKVTDQYVRETKRPIRRKDLVEYAFAYDSRTQEYDKVSKHDDSMISYAITRLLRNGKLVKLEYCKQWENGKCKEFYRKKEYLLPEHLQMPEIQEYLKKNGFIEG
ncbi:hypothetical protein [Metallosphaera sedula]|uniref:hypothetical protein n=1 Tax=Metallosphaera sedula TaxID=43687 RepID=UPI0020BE5E60|nr:hypothetical protein [Metallosphaera sedula]BBL48342.1 hypothetical protein MJ1HA_2464 [Metallosphaera sedula]